MVTADIMVFDSVLVDIVQDCKAELVPLTVVGLGNSISVNKSSGIFNIGCSSKLIFSKIPLMILNVFVLVRN